MKAVIFDLDGTLMDTIKDIWAAINYARVSFDGEPASIDDIKRYVGNGLKKALVESILEHGPRLEGDEELDLMFQLLMQYYKNHPSDYSTPYKGIPELLDNLKANGYRLGVLSNKADEIVQKIVGKFFPSDLFDYVQGQVPSLPLKPNPEAVDIALKKLGVEKEDAVLIGDSEVDFKTAINSGMKSIIVSYGFRSKEQLISAGACPIDHVPTLADIEKVLNN